MSHAETSPVFFYSLQDLVGRELDLSRVQTATGALIERMQLDRTARWGIKVHLGPKGRPAAVDATWAAAAAGKLGSRSSVLFDTLSITSEGLHTVTDLQATALAKNYPGDFFVADDPELGPPLAVASPVTHPSGRPGSAASLAAGLEGRQGLLILSAVDTHPHLGFQGAVSQLALGCSDRQARIDLHRDIRPQVDTPLCAGCGSCLAVCIFDAIDLKSGRAVIDHSLCTGCGECMTVCHLAGIAAERPESLASFQEKVAEVAAAYLASTAWAAPGRRGFVNYLVNLDRRTNRSAPRSVGRPPHLGILAAEDPVALDRATWDLLNEYSGKDLKAWCGYPQNPAVLLEKTASWTACAGDYRLVEIG